MKLLLQVQGGAGARRGEWGLEMSCEVQVSIYRLEMLMAASEADHRLGRQS